MEIVGGFMVMMSIIGLFVAVVWLIMPFVVFAVKGKQDRTLELLESMEKKLAVIEARLEAAESARQKLHDAGSNEAPPVVRGGALVESPAVQSGAEPVHSTDSPVE